MKTMLLAAAAVLAIGAGSAFAGDGDGQSATTLFTPLTRRASRSGAGHAACHGGNRPDWRGDPNLCDHQSRVRHLAVPARPGRWRRELTRFVNGRT